MSTPLRAEPVRTPPSDHSSGARPGLNRHGDLAPFVQRPYLAWDAANTEASLASIHERACEAAQVAITWYLKAKRPKQRGARMIRGGAIVLAALAGVIPMMAQSNVTSIEPVWASVALALGASAILADRFFGFSSAWMRFITTELQLRQLLDEFQLDWDAERASWKGAAPTDEQTQRGIGRCRTFISHVNGIVRDETKLWVTEFQESLRQLDDTMKARSQASAVGALNVVVANGHDSKDGWSLSIDGGPSRRAQGQTAAIGDLSPGHHTVRAVGVIGGKPVAAEKAISISPGAVAAIELTLA